jgi:hypothetical protein
LSLKEFAMRTPAIMLALSASPAFGDAIASWLWTVTTQDGDSIVEPRETATVTLSLLMQADDERVDEAIAFAIFDTLGGPGAELGHILGWEVLEDLDGLTGDLTTTDGVSLYNTNAGQLKTLGTGPFTSANPICVLEFEWAPVVDATFDVTYETFSYLDGPHTVDVWECFDGNGDVATYPVTEAVITFSVLACPADVNNDGALDILDFVTFQLLWQAADPAADCDANAEFNLLDFVCFQHLFQEGCP